MSGEAQMTIPLVALPVAQIGILVPDLAIALRQHACEGRRWAVYEYGSSLIPELTYRGAVAQHSWRLALSSDQPQLELLQPLDGPAIYDEWIEASGYGLHHLGVEVPSLSESIERMRAAGYDPIQTGSGYGLDGDGGYAYFDTQQELGYLIEAIERPARRRPPLRVVD